MFCGEGEDVLKVNDIIKFPKLAQTYRTIAENGPNAFYEGKMAQNLVDDIQKAGRVFVFVLFRLENKKVNESRESEAT